MQGLRRKWYMTSDRLTIPTTYRDLLSNYSVSSYRVYLTIITDNIKRLSARHWSCIQARSSIPSRTAVTNSVDCDCCIQHIRYASGTSPIRFTIDVIAVLSRQECRLRRLPRLSRLIHTPCKRSRYVSFVWIILRLRQVNFVWVIVSITLHNFCSHTGSFTVSGSPQNIVATLGWLIALSFEWWRWPLRFKRNVVNHGGHSSHVFWLSYVFWPMCVHLLLVDQGK